MERTIHWLKSALLITLSLLTINATAKENGNVDHEESRVEGKSIKITEDMYVELENQYGNVEIEMSKSDSLVIQATITVRGDDQSEVDELMEMIEIDIKETSGFILVETKWAEDVSLFRKSFHELSQTLGSKDVIQVDYMIKVPSKTNLEVNNRFGDVFIGDYDGELELEISHGDFRAHRLSNVKSIRAKYGKLKVKEITGGARLDLSFMDSAELDEVDDLFLKSASSEVEIGRAQVVQINSRHDEVRFESVGEISGMISLTDLEINEVVKKIDVTSKYGEVFIKEVGPEAELINLEGAYSDYHLAFSPMFESAFKVEITDNREFSYDEGIIVADQSQKDDYITYTGAIGESDERLVVVSVKSGYVKFGN